MFPVASWRTDYLGVIKDGAMQVTHYVGDDLHEDVIELKDK